MTSPPTTVAIPAGGTGTTTISLRTLRDAEVTIENIGPGPCEIDAPDGRIPYPNTQDTLPPGERLRLANIPDAWDEMTATIFSAAGTTVRVGVDGQAVPMVRGRKKTPVRNPETGLIEAVLEVEAWVPAP